MAKKRMTLKEIIEKIEKIPQMKRLPVEVRNLIKKQLRLMNIVEFPIITLKEEDWVVAQTPIIDVCAQGKTEEEAIENLKAMIDDWMTDPDTPKPKIEKILKMEIGIKNVPMKLSLSAGECYGKNTHVATR